ncbi:diacylglycerol kinase (ATP) [Filimonas lacunae]|uniref:Diacylglycerol kinase (ATP) n=1 Tax=Filimonas lacunae TaxID=477680 RepID=A0A173MJM0_9BACT|nr:diacylglycerol kinase family protein [Filimonas lacunae]BAV07833.1 diacylglycerol kinase [Filimonas lacunae]SIT05371.1 diacylglycerol kinase (ATP) [Filimonas lacunae]
MATAFSWKARLKSFVYAAQGIRTFFASEHNAWLHLAATVAAITLGFYYDITPKEWICVAGCITLVIVAEMVNTCIEKIMNHLSPEHHENVKQIKDIAAGAVLVAAIFAAITGCILFIPYILHHYPFN